MSDSEAEAAAEAGLAATEAPESKPVESTTKKANSRRNARRRKVLVELLPVIITGATFILSFTAQLWQRHSERKATIDSEWRKALQQVSSKDSETAIQGAYQMESFVNDDRYGGQARGSGRYYTNNTLEGS